MPEWECSTTRYSQSLRVSCVLEGCVSVMAEDRLEREENGVFTANPNMKPNARTTNADAMRLLLIFSPLKVLWS
jgi:hypothetical protein